VLTLIPVSPPAAPVPCLNSKNEEEKNRLNKGQEEDRKRGVRSLLFWKRLISTGLGDREYGSLPLWGSMPSQRR